ncbi:TonB-dependent receptor domain-containing protein [Janthinobacterium sp. PAMC25594]|uniref:TonB-dependent receptor domain-containing protein n=1 Tax=Janthinobacterium sp. PAMC25594 TaxID=2861284 RepID=UPI001C62C841|nr:TonB-dependent receptor [Janthinobacterium sp. PAMC25594]QYG09586.1 TonB-dependent receptor [Janthinobacterium sp. PAMC25594]
MTHAVSRHAALTSLALAIAAPAAFAQATPDTFDPIVVTASRYPQHLSEVLSDTQTISSEDIARSGAGTLIDLLQKQRGIEVNRSGGPGTNSSVFIRGANSNQNIVLVDGVRIGSATSGTANWSAVPLSSIDHVEIVYGPLSTMYGADAVGGVIQIFTKKGDGAARFSAFAGYGRYNTRQAEASVAGSTGGNNSFSYALTAGKEKSDGFSASKLGASTYTYNPDKDGYDKESVSGQFGYQMAKGHDVGLVFLNSKLDAQYDSGLNFDARNYNKLENISVFTKNQFLPNWTSELRYAQAKDKQTSVSAVGAFGRSQFDTKQSDISWQNDILIGRDTLQLLGEYRDEDVVSSAKGLSGGRNTKSFAASYNLVRGAHLASISGRRDDSSAYGTHNTGSVAYGYRFSNALRASASYGTSFRAPTFNDLYYPDSGIPTNKPEKGRNAEVGLHYNDGQSQLSATYYHNKITDMLTYVSACPVIGWKPGYGCSMNVDKALLEGVTLAGARKFGAFNVSGNIDLQDPRNETTDKQLARRAKKHANFAVDYTTGPLTAGTEWQLSGKRFEDAANKTTLGGYGLLNLYTTYQFARDWSVLARWNNITNKDYELGRFYATPGSNLFVGVRYGMK